MENEISRFAPTPPHCAPHHPNALSLNGEEILIITDSRNTWS